MNAKSKTMRLSNACIWQLPKLSLLLVFLLFIRVSVAQNTSLQWASFNSCTNYLGISKSTIDANGNYYKFGSFSGTMDFDPGPGTYNVTGYADYVTKLNAAGQFQWAVNIPGIVIHCAETDGSGNIVLVGSYVGTVDFDPSTGTNNMTAVGAKDIFILKLNSSGAFVWAKSIGGSSDDIANCVTTGANGSIAVAGQFIGTVDFDPSANTNNLVPQVSDGIFVLKLDAAGNYVWAKQLSGNGIGSSKTIKFDSNSNVIVLGHFNGTVDFDPGTGTANRTATAYPGRQHVYLCKLDASGNYGWAIQYASTFDINGQDIEITATGNVLLGGTFIGVVDFDPSANVNQISNTVNYCAYLTELNSNGTMNWVKNLQGTGGSFLFGIAKDASGRIYCAGTQNGPVDFDPSAATANITTNTWSSFIVSFSSNGNYNWVNSFAGTGNSQPSCLSALPSGEIYMTGTLAGMVDFDPNAAISNLGSVGMQDSYNLKINVGTFSQLDASSCGISLTSLNQNLYCIPVAGATNYRYEITGPNNFYTTFLRTNNLTNLDLSWITSIAYGTTYSIKVEAFVGGQWKGYGPSCSVTTPTPPTTQLSNTSCGITLNTLNQNLTCNAVIGASNYNYRIYDGTTLVADYFRTNGLTNLQLSWLSAIQYNKTYNIEVRASVGGQWHAFGNMCTVTTPTPPTNQLDNSSCGITLTTLNQNIYCNAVIGASNYNYRIYDGTTLVADYFRTNGLTNLQLSWLTTIQYNKTYNIEVRASVGGQWHAFGNMCTVTTPTPPTTQLDNGSCGMQIVTLNQNIGCEPVVGATNYNYRIYDGTTLVADYYRTNGLTNLQLSWLTTIQYNKTYNVEVRASVGGQWHPFGSMCTITTPTPPLTQIAPINCGMSLATLDQTFNCSTVIGASNYNYRIYDGNTNVMVADYYRTNGLTNMQLSWLPAIQYNKAYIVEVRANVGGQWHPFGPLCSLTTPPAPTTQLNTASCGINLSAMSQVLNCNAIIGASNYRYEISLNNAVVTTYVRGGNATNFTMPWALTNIPLSTTYDIKVAAFVGGVWLPYGNSCSIVTSATPKMAGEDGHQSEEITGLSNEQATNYTMKAIPNPTQKSTTITVDRDYQKASLKLNSAIGQTLMTKQFSNSQELTLDLDYPAGIYYLEVQIDEQASKTIKIVKE